MASKLAKIGAKLQNMVYLVENDEAKQELGAAFASLVLNPTVSWAKFILTDDRMNGNGQRIPKEEFANLINTGVHMPVKMALGEIAPGHDDSKPLGVITHLKEIETEDGSSAIVALAALWGEERPADVAFIKERHAKNQPVDVSWEILYENEVFNEALGSIDLISTALRAATVVGNPAYKGRTPFLAISSKTARSDESATVTEEVHEDITEETTVEKELQEKLDAALAEITDLKAKLSEKETAIAELATQKTTLEEEIAPLKEFKEKADAELAKAEKLTSIKKKFEEAKLDKDEKYFETNEETLFAMSEAQLDFMVQELKAFASVRTSQASNEEDDKTEIPALHSENNGEQPSVSELAQFLRSRNGKK
jgi:hypothetical protein